MVAGGGAAHVGAHRLTRIWEHQETIPKLAKEAGEDEGSTLLCLKKKKDSEQGHPWQRLCRAGVGLGLVTSLPLLAVVHGSQWAPCSLTLSLRHVVLTLLK